MDYIERLYNELNNEDASLWYFHSEHTSKIILKVPTTAIKSIYKGCKVQFLFGKDTNADRHYFHTGITIFDNSTNGLNILCLHRFDEEHKSLWKIMHEEKTDIEFYNELGFCFLYGYVCFANNDRECILQLLGDIENLYSGDLDAKANQSLDSFEYSLNISQRYDNVDIIETLRVESVFSNIVAVENHFIGLNENNEIRIDDLDEGGCFEKQIWFLLNRLFFYDLHKNPEIILKNKRRELTDILAFYEQGVFLIETKAMAIVTLRSEQTIDRKKANVQKQISKAIEQLIGAKKVLEKDIAVYDTKGNEIKFNRKIIPHCIVLVHELVPFGSWKEIESQIENTIVRENIYLNVFELMDFVKYVKISKGQKELLDYNLMQRTESFMKLKTIFLKGKIVDEKV